MEKAGIRSHPLYIIDVFSIGKKRFTGNQLAVVRETNSLSKEVMQRIANEMHFSETTFIDADKENKTNRGYDVRIFTPNSELQFAGHPTLGTAFAIQQKIIKRQVESVKLNLGVGLIPVSFSYRGGTVSEMWMKQAEPQFGEGGHSKVELSTVLGIEEEDFDSRFPIEDVSTGLYTTIVPLRNLEAVKKIRINSQAYYDYVRDRESKTILVFSPETYSKENQLNVRVFPIFYGVSEDPATGSGNGCLAAYLVKNGYFEGKKEIDRVRVEQGYEISRPSILLLKSRAVSGKISVEVGGSAVLVAEGKLYV